MPSTFSFRNPRPRPVVPSTSRLLTKPTPLESATKAYSTVIAPVLQEAAHDKMIDDVKTLITPEKKENTPVPLPQGEEHDEHSTMSYSLLGGLEPEHLPWSKEVHLVEDVNGVRKRYAAIVVVLSKRICSAKDLSVKS
jgi:hypothetical protein